MAAGYFLPKTGPITPTTGFPSIDHPSDKATVQITVTAPQKYDVVSNGALVQTAASAGRAQTHAVGRTETYPDLLHRDRRRRIFRRAPAARERRADRLVFLSGGFRCRGPEVQPDVFSACNISVR